MNKTIRIFFIIIGIFLILISFHFSLNYAHSVYQGDLNSERVALDYFTGFKLGDFFSIWLFIGIFLVGLGILTLETKKRKKFIVLIILVSSLIVICLIYYLIVSNIYSISTSDCETRFNIGKNQDWCYKIVASVNEDISICNKISGEQEKERCIYELTN